MTIEECIALRNELKAHIKMAKEEYSLSGGQDLRSLTKATEKQYRELHRIKKLLESVNEALLKYLIALQSSSHPSYTDQYEALRSFTVSILTFCLEANEEHLNRLREAAQNYRSVDTHSAEAILCLLNTDFRLSH